MHINTITTEMIDHRETYQKSRKAKEIMKANEIRRKLKILITGMTLAAMVTSMAACSSAPTGSTSGSAQSQAAVETTAESEAENVQEETGAADNAADSITDNTAEAEEGASADVSESTASASVQTGPSKEDIETTETVENGEDSSHAITADGEEASWSNTAVTKTGDSGQGDEADFYGDNAAIFAATSCEVKSAGEVAGTVCNVHSNTAPTDTSLCQT